MALVLLLPAGAAQGNGLPRIEGVQALAANQRIDLTWDAVVHPRVVGYQVTVYADGVSVQEANTSQPGFVFHGTNERTYVFLVAARAEDGTLGPPSNPVAATPRLDRDLQYLAAGLIATWLGLFAYAALLARKEARLEAKLEQLLHQRMEGKLP